MHFVWNFSYLLCRNIYVLKPCSANFQNEFIIFAVAQEYAGRIWDDEPLMCNVWNVPAHMLCILVTVFNQFHCYHIVRQKVQWRQEGRRQTRNVCLGECINSHLCIVRSFEKTINSLDERVHCQACQTKSSA